MFVDVEQQARAFGEPFARLMAAVTFDAYPDQEPPPVDVPDPSVVAPRDDVQF